MGISYLPTIDIIASMVSRVMDVIIDIEHINFVTTLLSEEVRRKPSGLAETSRSALSVDQRGRFGNRDKKKNGGQNSNWEKIHPSRGVRDIGNVV